MSLYSILQKIFVFYFSEISGVLLAILESIEFITPIIGPDGKTVQLPPGAVSAGYQNFFICIEMFFAAIALRYAFPIQVYLGEGGMNGDVGRSVTMQSISSSLKVGKSMIESRKGLQLLLIAGNNEHTRHHDGCNPQLSSSVSAVYSVQLR